VSSLAGRCFRMAGACARQPMWQVEGGPTVGWACSTHLAELVLDVQMMSGRAVLVASLDGPAPPGMALARRAEAAAPSRTVEPLAAATVEVMSQAEWTAAAERSLARLGLTFEQLAAMAGRDEFVSLSAKKLWLAIGSGAGER
jgi:hypothetical protein